MQRAWQKMILDLTKTDGSIQLLDAPDNAEGDYSNLNLSRAWIRDRNLTNNYFFGTDLSDSKFENCELYWAQFNNALLTNATFIHCNLAGAIFDGAILKNTKFISCSLPRDGLGGATSMLDTNTETVIFEDCDLTGLKTDRVGSNPLE